MKFNKEDLLLYAVTDRRFVKEDSTLLKDIEKAIRGGATMIQIREKDMDQGAFIEEVKKAKKICDAYGVILIVDDDVQVTKQANASGVHIGQHDMSLKDARSILGDEFIIGVSCQTVEQAKEAELNGATYLGVGAIFQTNTKNDADDVSLQTLRNICDAVSIPVVAIGGIESTNINQLQDTHIDGVAIVSAIFDQDDIEQATRKLLNQVKGICK